MCLALNAINFAKCALPTLLTLNEQQTKDAAPVENVFNLLLSSKKKTKKNNESVSLTSMSNSNWVADSYWVMKVYGLIGPDDIIDTVSNVSS